MLKCAKGHVLEVAAGTLESLKLYGGIESLTAVDKSVMMCFEMKRKVEDVKPDFPVTIICGDASDLPFENESFHTVVTSHALCSVEHPERSLDEIARVMKPSGRYFALERGRVYYRYLRSLLEWLKVYPNPAVPWKYGHFENRDPISLIKGCSELTVTDSEVFGYGINYAIVARRANSDKITEFANDPTPKEGAKIIYQYIPHTL
ncbi:methyltransferase domain-containing protein [Babesia ovata]|uniref:Methyltransferase domain-containing protein n=1 Tax=Babesia ovata TaxID=189622 RepID=A0A2H6KA44_9APIC|nr:methyltransferase domain-containing protein [Babesia ovata]GBE59855.1 methyltransferase domain-containing protein [Babesia ovata]